MLMTKPRGHSLAILYKCKEWLSITALGNCNWREKNKNKKHTPPLTHEHKLILTAACLWKLSMHRNVHSVFYSSDKYLTSYSLFYIQFPSVFMIQLHSYLMSFLSLPASIFSRYLGCRDSHPCVCLTAKKDWSRKVQSLVRSKHSSRLNGYRRDRMSERGWASQKKKGRREGGNNSRRTRANQQLLEDWLSWQPIAVASL